jgi:tetratricopeptide (TPR) repeat protein
MALISLSDSRFSDIFRSNSFGRSSSGIAEVARIVNEAQKERVEDDGGASGGRVTKPPAVGITAPDPSRFSGVLERLAKAPYSHTVIKLHSHRPSVSSNTLALSRFDSSEGRLQDSGVKDPIAATLFLSIDQISRDNAFAADCLFLAACVDRKNISLDLVEAASAETREDAIRVLDKYALITRRPAESALDLHRLVHQALRKRLQVQGQLIQRNQRTIVQLLRVFPDSNHSNRSKWRRLLPHVQYTLSHSSADDDDEERLRLASRCAMTLSSDGRWKEAEELQVQVMRTRKRVLTDDHPNTLGSMNNLAATYREQGRWKEAEELGVQVLQTRRRMLTDEHPDTLTSMANLALTYWNQGRWKEAEELGVQVWQTRKRVLTDDHPNTLSSMANLAATYRSQGRWNEAEELEVQVMQTRKRVLTDEHPDTLTSMYNLAFTLQSQARHEEAFALMETCFQLREQVLGEEHPNTQLSLNILSSWRAESE